MVFANPCESAIPGTALIIRCPCSKIYPWGNGSALKNVAEDFAMEHLALSGPERLARVLGAIASSGLVADRSELSGRNGRACVVTMGA
jgi:hypothetical protein